MVCKLPGWSSLGIGPPSPAMRMALAILSALVFALLAGCGNGSNSGGSTGGKTGYVQAGSGSPSYDGPLDEASISFYLFHPNAAVPAGGVYRFEVRGTWADASLRGLGQQIASDHIGIHFTDAAGVALPECAGLARGLPGDNFVDCPMPTAPGRYVAQAHLVATWGGRILEWWSPTAQVMVE